MEGNWPKTIVMFIHPRKVMMVASWVMKLVLTSVLRRVMKRYKRTQKRKKHQVHLWILRRYFVLEMRIIKNSLTMNKTDKKKRIGIRINLALL